MCRERNNEILLWKFLFVFYYLTNVWTNNIESLSIDEEKVKQKKSIPHNYDIYFYLKYWKFFFL